MKVIIARVLSPILYWVGHFFSKLFESCDSLGWLFYPIYNWCMITSSNIEDWAGVNIMWNPVEYYSENEEE